jgi:hypothetical protein
MTVVVDDHLLLDLLADVVQRDLRAELFSGEIFTTGSWYYRLGRAVTAGTGEGALSGRVHALPEQERARVVESIVRLPPEIGLLGFRAVVPVMLTLRGRRPLNLLTAEALAVAVLTDAEILTKTPSGLLQSTAGEVGVACRLLA